MKAIAADSFNSKILDHFNIFKNIKDKGQTEPADYNDTSLCNSLKGDHDVVKKSLKNIAGVGMDYCILCRGDTELLCEKCKLKNDYRDIFAHHDSKMVDMNSLHNLSDILLEETI